MIYIKYPQTELKKNEDLVKWLEIDEHKRKWTDLKTFLYKHLWNPYGLKEEFPKCWYSEVPIADHFAEDVEHFRPKASAQPLNNTQKKKIEAELGYAIPEEISKSAYPWLEFNYTNYRIVTAFTNRGGGKVASFPVLKGTKRLSSPQIPEPGNEYPLLLDPTDKHDSSVLIVMPSGAIIPKATKAQPSDFQFQNLKDHWHDSEFDFLRGWVSIVVYQLDFKTAVIGRHKVYENVKTYISRLERDVNNGLSDHINDHLEDIEKSIRMYSPFALSARCATISYDPISAKNDVTGKQTQQLLQAIYNKVIQLEHNLE
jgi:hypothetical protein